MTKFDFKKKSTVPELDPEIASRMLENVFEACHVEPNEVPLEVLTSYSNYRKERYSMQKLIILIAMIMWVLIPLLFFSPKFTFAEKYANTGMPKYEIYVHTILPVSKVTATIGDKNFPVYEMDAHNFSVQPTCNGEMTVTVTLFNKQISSQVITVDSYDDQIPELLDKEITEESMTLYVQDTGTGIDYEDVIATTEDGTQIKPESYDESAGSVTFPYPTETMDVFIPDIIGNTLHLHVTVDPATE